MKQISNFIMPVVQIIGGIIFNIFVAACLFRTVYYLQELRYNSTKNGEDYTDPIIGILFIIFICIMVIRSASYKRMTKIDPLTKIRMPLIDAYKNFNLKYCVIKGIYNASKLIITCFLVIFINLTVFFVIFIIVGLVRYKKSRKKYQNNLDYQTRKFYKSTQKLREELLEEKKNLS